MSSDVRPTDPTLAAGEAAVPGTEELATIVAGRYEILGLLGAGGMGRVYRAHDRVLGEVVALKVLHRDLVHSAAMVERFRQEVRLARKVTHKNVARTFDIGQHGADEFLTMELIVGEALSARLDRGLLPVHEALAIARDILAGMSAAHDVGVVHRDLKPDNVLLERGGRVVITDFGIARANADADASKTGGQIVGTPAYMAPEQVSGSAGVDHRADIYAFGAILFEMLTGARAWSGTSALAVAAARLVEPPPDPRAVRSTLGPALAAVVVRCLARDRDARYASCAEATRALDGAAVDDGSVPMGERPLEVRRSSLGDDDARARTIAVVPFKNFGPPEDAYFAEGLTDDLVDVLTTVRGLRVRGRAYAEPREQDVVDTGRRLGVDVVVAGSVRRSGDDMRVNVRLVGVADGFSLWSSRFDRSAGDSFVLNDEVARAIAAALAAESARTSRPQPTDPAAIDLYFRARQALYAERQEDAATLFRQALTRAPDDPTILAGHAYARIGRNFFAPLPPDEARSLVRRALEVGGALADPWIALGAYRFHEGDDAATAMGPLRRALEIAPSSADAHDRVGRILLEVDAWDEALLHLERALWIDPQQRWARVDRMRAAALEGDWQKADELLHGGPGPEWIGHRVWQFTRIWSWPGAPPRSFTVPDGTPPHFRTLNETYERARQHRRGDAPYALVEIIATVDALSGNAPPRSRVRRFFRQVGAELVALCGHTDGALDLVQQAVDAGLVDLAWMNRLSVLDPLREEARFKALRETVADRARRVLEAWRASPESLEEALASLG